jgi:hypothetical protein
MGRGMGISAVVVFLSLFVWGWLLDGVGAILAVPLTMIIISVLKSFDNTRWIATLMCQSPDDKDDEHRAAQDKLLGLWGQRKLSFGKKKQLTGKYQGKQRFCSKINKNHDLLHQWRVLSWKLNSCVCL